MTEISPWLLAAFATGAAVLFWLRRAHDRWQRRRRAARAIRGERAAKKLLHATGWKVVAEQARQSCSLRAGGEDIDFELIADFIVKKDGQQMVAEVKTGAGRSISHAGTRRQLLEYRLAFDVDGVLLVDPNRGSVTLVEFHLALTAAHALESSRAGAA